MNKNLNHLLDSKHYLYNCNLQRDIENNIGEIEIPEFTMEHINNIDKKYKIYNSNINDIRIQNQYLYSDEEIVKKFSDSFELNELFIEHVVNMEKLQDKMNEYISITEKTNKLQIYFQDIIPVIQNDEDNLKTVLDLLSNMD